MPTVTPSPQAAGFGLLRTITVEDHEPIPSIGDVIRIVEQSDGIEAHTFWRVRRVEAAGEGEIAITGEYVGGT